MTTQTSSATPAAARLLFARHGATAPNLAGLRCGGDLDPPLAEAGRRQAVELGRALAALPEPPDLIVTSDLLRTRETAAIVRAAIGPLELRVLAGLRERSLGRWNLQPIADTEAGLASGQTPPGGESGQAFAERIRDALDLVYPALMQRRVLMVGSKGVGRVLRELAGAAPAAPLGNAQLIELSLPLALTRPPLESLA